MTYKKLEHQIKMITLHDLDIEKVTIKDVRKRTPERNNSLHDRKP